jgi:hypothetical protein
MNYVEPHEFKKKDFEFELGEVVKLKGSYHNFFIKGRGKIQYLDGNIETTYLGNVNGERTALANEYEIERKE